MSLSMPPVPKSPEDVLRWEHTRSRRVVMEGDWRSKLSEYIKKQAGAIRADAWGEPDTTSNVVFSVSTQLSTLYASTPKTSHPQAFGMDVLSAVEDGGLWGLMPRVQRDTLALREHFIRVDIEESGRLTYRPVPPDLVVAEGDRRDCDRLTLYKEARERAHPETGKLEWVWDVFDLRGKTPSFKVLSADQKTDISKIYKLEGIEGAEYLKLWKDPETGEPIIPAVVYHAEITGSLFDAWTWSELYWGTLSVAVLWTYYGHCVRDASHPQRYAAGVSVPAAIGDDDTPRHAVVADASTVLVFTMDDENKQPMIGQWAPGADPAVLCTSIQTYERKVASFANISESDFARTSGDPRSGYALSISRDSARRAARRFEPAFSRSDKRTIALTAALMSSKHTKAYPTRGYAVEYPGPAKTREEILQEIERLFLLGLITRADAYRMLHPDVNPEEAKAITETIKAEQSAA